MASLFDTLFGNNSVAKTSNQATNNVNQGQQESGISTTNSGTTTSGTQQNNQTQNSSTNSNTNTSNNSSAVGSSNTSNVSVTSTLDPATQQLLKNLLPTLITHAQNPDSSDADAIRNISQLLATNAMTPAVSADDIAGQKSAAVTSFNNNEAVDIGRLKQSIGSTGNTYAQQVDQKGQTDLASTLAGIVANANLTNKQLQTQGLTSAIGGLSDAGNLSLQSGSSAIAQLMSVITGLSNANSVTSTNGTTNTSQDVTGGSSSNTNSNTISTLQDLLQSLQQADTSAETDTNTDTASQLTGLTTSDTKGTQNSNKGVVGSILGLFS